VNAVEIWQHGMLLVASDLSRPRVHVQVLLPVIADGVKRIVYTLPRGALGLLKQNAHVPALVGACVSRPR
jgi:hypothetical protein